MSPRPCRRASCALAIALPWLLCSAASPPDFTAVPGIVIDHRPASTGQYIGSPSLVLVSSNRYVASHDWFGPGTSNDQTVVFASSDRGAHWKPLTTIAGQWWSTLFAHEGALYLLGTSRQNGAVVIRRSADLGRSWTTPRDANSGLLLPDSHYHCAPVPVVLHNGRLWRAMEDTLGPPGWPTHFRAFMMSAPAKANLLEAASWTSSTPLGGNAAWLDGQFRGWLEGNAVVAPDGEVVDLLRVDYPGGNEKAALVHMSSDGLEAKFDPAADFLDLPGGAKKFTIRYDIETREYWALSNYVPEPERAGDPGRTRNTLALIRSPDLRHWKVQAILLHHPDRLTHGFQYADWQFDGPDLVAVVRTAFDDGLGGAHNQHDANFLTFHRVAGFRHSQQ